MQEEEEDEEREEEKSSDASEATLRPRKRTTLLRGGHRRDRGRRAGVEGDASRGKRADRRASARRRGRASAGQDSGDGARRGVQVLSSSPDYKLMSFSKLLEPACG